MPLKVSSTVLIADDEIQLSATRAQGAGGQNVNKVSSAIHLRFDIPNSSLPDYYKQCLLDLKDSRINKEGVLIIKAQQFRTQDKNREDALDRLLSLVRSATASQKQRRATKPSFNQRRKRMDNKTKRSQTKANRGKMNTNHEQ